MSIPLSFTLSFENLPRIPLTRYKHWLILMRSAINLNGTDKTHPIFQILSTLTSEEGWRGGIYSRLFISLIAKKNDSLQIEK